MSLGGGLQLDVLDAETAEVFVRHHNASLSEREAEMPRPWRWEARGEAGKLFFPDGGEMDLKYFEDAETLVRYHAETYPARYVCVLRGDETYVYVGTFDELAPKLTKDHFDGLDEATIYHEVLIADAARADLAARLVQGAKARQDAEAKGAARQARYLAAKRRLTNLTDLAEDLYSLLRRTSLGAAFRARTEDELAATQGLIEEARKEMKAYG